MVEGTGLRTIASTLDFGATLQRLKHDVAGRGLVLFAEIDHGAGAAAAGLDLRPTVLLIFGSAKAGTPLMQADQRIGLDLPLKALVWVDPDGITQITVPDPAWLADRYGIASRTGAVTAAMTTLLAALAGG